jgi:hypothetical protein
VMVVMRAWAEMVESRVVRVRMNGMNIIVIFSGECAWGFGGEGGTKARR